MDPRYKLKGVLLCMHHYCKSMCLDEIKEKNVRDGLERMYRAYDQRYSYFMNLGCLFFCACYKFKWHTLQLMWVRDRYKNLECYNIDRVFFHPEEKATLP